MTREQYETISLVDLKAIAKTRKIKVTGLKKAGIIDAMLKQDEIEAGLNVSDDTSAPAADENNDIVKSVKTNKKTVKKTEDNKIVKEDIEQTDQAEKVDISSNSDFQQEDIKEEQAPAQPKDYYEGVLEVLDTFGFIRSDGIFSGSNDVYVSNQIIRQYSLRTGDYIRGELKPYNSNEKNRALSALCEVNGKEPDLSKKRPKFEKLTPIFPNERILLESDSKNTAMRMVDVISPIGKGQRGMIVSPPKAGKTTLLKNIASSILINNPEIYLIILLIDERPEEVTDIKESIVGEKVMVVASTFDELPERHKRVAEMTIEQAKRLAEDGKDVVILLDSITRLTRAYNTTITASGRTLSGGLDPMALHMPKRFFGAARNLREAGSLTILATALVDTGSKMDDVVYEEFKGTGNMELILNRKLQEKRVFPAIDIPKSGTRREDLLLNSKEMTALDKIHRAVNGKNQEDVCEEVIRIFSKTKDNKEFVDYINRTTF